MGSTSNEVRIGVFPGTFNPPTVAHLAIAEAARSAHRLDRVDLVLSRSPINKEHVVVPSFAQRLAVLEAVCDRVSWLRVEVTDARLIADIAEGYNVVIMGADKWEQVNDPRYYNDSPTQRDAALERLPDVALFAREGSGVVGTVALDDRYLSVSSSLARSGAHHLMVPEAHAAGWWHEPDADR